MEQTQTLRPGTLLHKDDYRIVSVLGRGGFGITYLAVVENLGKKVAIKEFFPSGMYQRDGISGFACLGSTDNAEMSDKLKAKFLKEARRMAQLRHESIVAVNNAFEENGTAYYVMDFIEGRDLQSIVRTGGPLSVDVAVKYICQVGSALEYLHGQKINHLDVKPANILVDPVHNRALLIDFGLSKQYDSNDRQTSTTPVGISHGYAPNEQYKPGGVSQFSAPTDIYSLGATLYFLLTGTTPPTASELVEEPLRFPPTMLAYIQDAIRRAMAFTRADRFQTVADFLAALSPGVPTPIWNYTEPVEIEVEMPQKIQRNWLKPIMIIFVLLGAIACFVYFKSNVQNNKDLETEEVAVTPKKQTVAPILKKDSGENIKKEYTDSVAKMEASPYTSTAPVKNAVTAEAIAYLDNNKVWTKVELESYPVLVGLYDDLNNYRTDAVVGYWKNKLARSKVFSNLVHHMLDGRNKPKAKALQDTQFDKNSPGRITVQKYLWKINP